MLKSSYKNLQTKMSLQIEDKILKLTYIQQKDTFFYSCLPGIKFRP
jgi:hypothetical protein